jgi:uncharacterized damage-inducible protein DinB
LTARTGLVGIEEFGDGRVDLWIPLVPGAHARAGTGEPLAQGRAALTAFADWLEQHGLPAPPALDLDTVQHRAATREGDHWINATFDDDDVAVDSDEFFAVLSWLAASREDLLSALADLDDAALDRRPPAGRNIREILDHLASAEAWYASRLDPREAARAVVDSRAGAPSLERLAAIRDDVESFLRQRFGDLARARRELPGETWSLRKVLRGLVSHERRHTAQIERLARQFAAAAWFEGQGPDEGPAGGSRDRGG